MNCIPNGQAEGFFGHQCHTHKIIQLLKLFTCSVMNSMRSSGLVEIDIADAKMVALLDAGIASNKNETGVDGFAPTSAAIFSISPSTSPIEALGFCIALS